MPAGLLAASVGKLHLENSAISDQPETSPAGS
jgi:hypothetical protein